MRHLTTQFELLGLAKGESKQKNVKAITMAGGL